MALTLRYARPSGNCCVTVLANNDRIARSGRQEQFHTTPSMPGPLNEIYNRENMKYIVTKIYADAPENPIKIIKGEILEFIEESNPTGDWPNWIFCRGVNKEGWVPKQLLKIIDKTVTVLKDYDATEHNLAVDEILISEYQLNGWVWGYKEGYSNVNGWAPLNYLRKL